MLNHGAHRYVIATVAHSESSTEFSAVKLGTQQASVHNLVEDIPASSACYAIYREEFPTPSLLLFVVLPESAPETNRKLHSEKAYIFISSIDCEFPLNPVELNRADQIYDHVNSVKTKKAVTSENT